MAGVAASDSAEVGFDTQISATNQMLTLHPPTIPAMPCIRWVRPAATMSGVRCDRTLLANRLDWRLCASSQMLRHLERLRKSGRSVR